MPSHQLYQWGDLNITSANNTQYQKEPHQHMLWCATEFENKGYQCGAIVSTRPRFGQLGNGWKAVGSREFGEKKILLWETII